MRTVCQRESLLSACQLTSAAMPTRGDLKPILKNIKAVAGDDRFTLIATDQEVGIRLDVQGLEVEETGEAILPAKKLIDILREANDDRLVIEKMRAVLQRRLEHYAQTLQKRLIFAGYSFA